MTHDADKAVYDLTPAGRIIVLMGVVLASTCYTATILVATTLLPQMQGGLSATQDEISWVMTFNIIATAVATPTTGWLVSRFGRQMTMLGCLTGFSGATFMCGASTSLEMLVFWRVMQGGLGAPLVPLSQTLLLDIYPRSQHGFVMSLYGMSNILGPVIGPTLGGYVGEQMGWPWGFSLVLPVSALAFILFRYFRRRSEQARSAAGLDRFSLALRCHRIRATRPVAWTAARLVRLDGDLDLDGGRGRVLLYLPVAQPDGEEHVSHPRAFPGSQLRHRVYPRHALLPPLLQQHAGFPDSAIGTFVAWRGVGNGLGFFAAMWLQRLDPRLTMIIATLVQTSSGWWIAHVNLDVDQTTLAINSLMQGFSVGVFWVPLTVVTFSTLAPQYRAEGSSVFHLLRNLGSSLFISVAVPETGANYSRMTELATAYNKVWQLPWVTGAWTTETLTGIARLSKEITRQATMIGFTNAFVLYTLLSAIAVPLCLLIRPPRKG